MQAKHLIPLTTAATFHGIQAHGFVKDEQGQPYTVYLLSCSSPHSSMKWMVFRRYKQFKELAQQVGQEKKKMKVENDMPAMGNNGHDFVIKVQLVDGYYCC